VGKRVRPNVELNQPWPPTGLSTLLPASRLGIFVRNQTMRALPVLARFGRVSVDASNAPRAQSLCQMKAFPTLVA